MLEIEENIVLRIPKRFVLHEFNEEMHWIFDMQDGDIFELNSSSYFMISCFDGKNPLHKILDTIILRYPDTNPQQISDDFKNLLNRMINEHVLELL